MYSRLFPILIGSAALLFASCTESNVESDANSVAVVETLVSPQIIIQGSTVSVDCRALNGAGAVLGNLETQFTVSPAVEPVQNTFTPSAAGEYAVTCGTVDGALLDPTPARVWVVAPEDADKVVVDTLLEKGSAAINEAVGVTCTVAIAGLILSEIQTRVHSNPSVGITVDSHTVTGQIDEDFYIACFVPDTGFQDPDPALLVVGLGGAKPTRITTALDQHTVTAGEPVQVTCTASGANGQVLEYETTVDAPAGIVVSGKSLSPHNAGTHTITCQPATPVAGVELVPDTLTVNPGVPVAVEAWVQPPKPTYKPSDVITIQWQGKDSFDNVIPGAPATITAPVQGVAKQDEDTFELLADGYYTFTLTLLEGSKPSTNLEITVDGNGPDLAILTPERGQTLSGNSAVQVTGTAVDTFGGIASLTVNGYAVTPNEAGAWSFTVNSAQGLNPVVVEAVDYNGNSSKATVAWYYSTDWVPTDKAAPEAAWLDDTVHVWLSQTIIDDGDHTEESIDDLAHLLEVLLTGADLGLLLGKPVLFEQTETGIINEPNFGGLDVDLTGDLTIWAEIDSVTFGQATVSLLSRDGGIDFNAHFAAEGAEPGFSVLVKVYVQLTMQATSEFEVSGLGTIPLNAVIEPPPTIVTTSILTFEDLGLQTSFDIEKLVGQTLTVTGKELFVSPENVTFSPLADATFDLGDVVFYASPLGFEIKIATIDLGQVSLTELVSGINQLFSSVADLILNNVLAATTEVLEPLIAILGGNALEMALKSLEVEEQLTMPEFFVGQAPASVDVAAKLSHVQFTEAGATIGLTGTSVAEKVVDRSPLGSILRNSCLAGTPENYTLPKTGAMEFALSLDLMNQVLFSLWYNGGLNFTVDAANLADLGNLNISSANITMDPLLPPILSDCNSKGTLRVQLGDSHISVDVLLGDVPVQFKAWLSAEIDVGVVASGQQVGVVVNGVSLFELEIYDVQGPFQDHVVVLETLLKDVLLEQLLGLLTDSALTSYPVPSFDIGNFIGGPQGGASLQLDGLQVQKVGGYLQVEGTLQ